MRCPSCGAKCKPRQSHCEKCGRPVDPRVAVFGGAARDVREAWGLDAYEKTAVAPQSGTGRRRSAVFFAALALALVALGAVGGIVLVKTPGAQTRSSSVDTTLWPALKQYDLDGSGDLSTAESLSVTDVDCSGLGLRSLEGLATFKNLVSLDASGNALTSVDLTGFANLQTLDLSDNAIEELDLSGNGELTSANVADNGMVKLNLAGCDDLATLSCEGNALARLDLSPCTALVTCTVDPGQNVSLPLAENFFPDGALRAALASVDANGDGTLSQRERESTVSLTVADAGCTDLEGLAWFPNLIKLELTGCTLETLDASVLPRSLTSLAVTNCQVQEVSLGTLEHLSTLDLSKNPITSVDLSSLVNLTSLAMADCNLKQSLDLTLNVRLTSVDVRDNPNLTSVEATPSEALLADNAIKHDDACTVNFAWSEEPSGDAEPGESPAEGDEGAGEMEAGEEPALPVEGGAA